MATLSIKSFGDTQGVHVQTAYVGKDNPIEMILYSDDKEYDYSTAKSLRVKIGDSVIDSQLEADAFNRDEAQLGRLKVYIGEQTIAPQAYNVKLEITNADDRILYFGHIRVKIEDPGI